MEKKERKKIHNVEVESILNIQMNRSDENTRNFCR